MVLNFQTAIDGCDDEGRKFADDNREALLTICLMLAPTFVGMIKTECKRSGILVLEDVAPLETDISVGK